MRETLYNSVRTKLSIPIATRTANAATNGTAINTNLNLQNFRVALLVVVTGTMTDGTSAITVQDSADGSTAWAAVATDRVQGSLPTLTATDDDAVFEIGVLPDPTRPFLRAVSTQAGATAGGTLGAVFVLGEPAQTPVNRT